MIGRIGTLGALACTVAFAAFAHSGVKNPAVMARMEGMKSMGLAVKTLGDMAKGKVAFDADAVALALERLALEAERTEALFEAKEDDPKSEALPVIWTQFADFEAKAHALEAVLAAQNQDMSDAANLGPTLKAIGAQCSACHKIYRK